MRTKGGNTAIQKLKKDIDRYLTDYNLSSPLKLILINEFWPVLLFRIEEYVDSREKKNLCQYVINILALLFHPFVNGLSGTKIFRGAQIGEGVLLHGSFGIVVTARAIICNNCTFFPGAAVIQKANGKKEGAPKIGNNVKLMNGCKIIGAVTIEDNVVVGANAVVLQDIPKGAIAVGIPAVIKKNH